MSRLFLLLEKDLDLFGDSPTVWEPKGYTDDVEVAILWNRSATRDHDRNYNTLNRIEKGDIR